MSLELDPALEGLMDARVLRLMGAAALEGAVILEANLGSTSGGGVQYPNLPNRSSAPGEFPTRQSGELQSGVTAEQGAGLDARVVIHDDPGKLLGLEFSPPSKNPNQPGTPKRHSGGRAPMWETLSKPATIRQMEGAMKRTP